jgi:hypothetical protein
LDGELHDLNNVSALYDVDPAGITDPTSADSDMDGMNDGLEDFNLSGGRDEKEGRFIETDPSEKDSDGDGIADGDEGDRNGNGGIDELESSAISDDTDNDGLSDSEEARRGTLPNDCDTDGDGLPDGLESGVVHPLPDDPKCRGLQTAGSNFARNDVLRAIRQDSDGDGIADGGEDKNANGWLDPGETDPTTPDTDEDGINDYIEMTGDMDKDGKPDIDPYAMDNGPECSPPAEFRDADCDGVMNAADNDSDNDGCMDRDESLTGDDNMNGIPDPYDSKTAKCGGAPAPAAGSAAPSAGGSAKKEPAEGATRAMSYLMDESYMDGGTCSLAPQAAGGQMALPLALLVSMLAVLRISKKIAVPAIFLATFLAWMR